MVNFELIPIVFLFIMIYLTYFAYLRKQIAKYGLLFWTALWIFGIILVVFHSFFNPIIDKLNVARVFDLYTIGGFLGVLFILFYLFKTNQRLESKIEHLTRAFALKPLLIKNKEMKTGR